MAAEGRRVELLERFRQSASQLLFNGLDDLRVRKGLIVILQPCKSLYVGGRQQAASGREDLPELDVDRPHLFQVVGRLFCLRIFTQFRNTFFLRQDRIQPCLGGQMGLLQLGNISLDGTKIQADASKSKAVSYKRLLEIEALLQAEVQQLFALAEHADSALPEGMNLPQELARRVVPCMPGVQSAALACSARELMEG